jgi:RNA dependent RNA polymerase
MVTVGDTSWTVEAMRASLGDFSMCLTAPKYAARMGQCFSTTFQGRDYQCNTTSSASVFIIGDVQSSLPRHVYSDGNGLMRRSAMNSLLQRIPSCPKGKEHDYATVQIRTGGAKGTLTAWDDGVFDSVLLESGVTEPLLYDVVLRDSLVKFEACYEEVEICW